jgi:hypothetical protein
VPLSFMLLFFLFLKRFPADTFLMGDVDVGDCRVFDDWISDPA